MSTDRASTPRLRRARTRPLPSPRSAGELRVLGPFRVQGLAVERRVRLYLPAGYHSGSAAHPILCLFDGQNVFDDAGSFAGGWHAHEAVDRLATARRPAPVVVGIDHGGDARITELSPFDTERGPGQLDALLEWMAATLLPSLRREHRLVPGPGGVVVGGSSMGGLAAMYAHYRRPEAFGGAIVMSPSFFIGNGGIFPYVASQPVPWTSKVYLDCGAREGGGRMLALSERMAGELRAKGYGDDRLKFRADPRGTHSEKYWRKRLPGALRFQYVGR